MGTNGELLTLTATERVVLPDGIKVYNFSVEGNHNYFILAQVGDYGQTCILVHNACPDDLVKHSDPETARRLGIQEKQLHAFKKKLITEAKTNKEVAKALKKMNTNNPDIWLSATGKIGLGRPQSNSAIQTGLTTTCEVIKKIIEKLH